MKWKWSQTSENSRLPWYTTYWRLVWLPMMLFGLFLYFFAIGVSKWSKQAVIEAMEDIN